ncbi:MAG TPA: RIP metalloprotease RseP [Nitrospiraceae bacterium]|nr:RIP metalloprotease RseP [Nitrospiraceae bacterium]
MTFLSAIVLLGILIFVHELGHFIIAKLMGVSVQKFSLGFGPRLIGKKIGETDCMISAIPLGGYVKMLGESPGEELKEEDKARAYNYQPVWKRMSIVVAGSLSNVLLAYVIFVFFLAHGLPVNIPNLDAITPAVDEVVEGSPAERAGLKVGDRIKTINDKTIDTWFDMISIIREHPGKKIKIELERNGKLLTVDITPEAVKEVDIKGQEIFVGKIGIIKAKSPFHSITAENALNAPIKGVEAVYEMSALILRAIKEIVTGALSPKTIGGPITIIQQTGEAAAISIILYLKLMAFISINLGILNLLPIPILDGGHLMFLSIEAIRKRPLKEKTLLLAQKIGFAMIIALMTLAIYNDIVRLITGKMF